MVSKVILSNKYTICKAAVKDSASCLMTHDNIAKVSITNGYSS